MSASPVTPGIAQDLVPTASMDKCLALNKVLLQLPLRFYQLINYLFDTDGNLSDSFRAQAWPPGAVMEYAGGSSPPGNWLECNGAAISRPIANGGSVDTYSDLWDVIGTTYGEGDAATTFNVPDKRGRAGIGAGVLTNDDATTGETYTQGERVGEEGVVLEMVNLPEEPAPLGDKVEGLIMKRTAAVAGDGPASNYTGGAEADIRRRDNESEDHADNVMGDLGDGEAHNNVTPGVVMRYWIAY